MNAGGALPLGKSFSGTGLSRNAHKGSLLPQSAKFEGIFKHIITMVRWKQGKRDNAPAISHRPLQITALPHQLFKLAIMRPVNIHAMLLKTAIEEIYEEPQRDLAQPEIFR